MTTLITIMTCITVIPIGLSIVLPEVSCRKTIKKNNINLELLEIYAQTAIDEAARREDSILNELTENR